jgi:rhodanese-related sulfurtransferase
VLPTHGAGSFCAASGDGRRWTTIGYERRANPLLQVEDEDHFVRAVLEQLGTYPPYFLRLRELNRLGPQIYGAMPMLDRLSADQVKHQRSRGAVVIDVRPVADYAAAHIPGSVSNVLRPQFASWLGWLVEDPLTPLIFVTTEHSDRRELVRQCLNIGYERLVGETTIDTWRRAGGVTGSVTLLEAAALGDRRLLDVRQSAEFAAGHVPGACNIELGALPNVGGAFGDEPVAVMCGHGERAATAASLLEAAGHDDVAVLDGGPADWARLHGRELAR